MNDCLTNPPDLAGWWNVSIKGIMSCCAIYWYFDGTNWDVSYIEGPLKQGDAGWWPNTRRDSDSD